MQIPPCSHGLLLHSSTTSIQHVKHQTGRFHTPVSHSADPSLLTRVTAALIYNIDLTRRTSNRSISHSSLPQSLRAGRGYCYTHLQHRFNTYNIKQIDFTLQSPTVQIPPCSHGLLLHSSTTSIQHVKHQTGRFHTPVSHSADPSLLTRVTAALIYNIDLTRGTSNRSISHSSLPQSLCAGRGYCYTHLQHRFNTYNIKQIDFTLQSPTVQVPPCLHG